MSIPKEILAAIGMPETLDTPLGRFAFHDGLPAQDGVDGLFDALDLVRAVEAFLVAMPGASLAAMRTGLRSVGVTSARQIGVTEPRLNSTSLYLTPDTDTTYGHTFLDLDTDGPTVVEVPPNSLCVVDDFWFRHVTDLGLAGPDQGKGGKYLFLPPDHEDEVPDGYFTFRSPTFTNWAMFRALDGVDAVKSVRVYPLSQAAYPPPNEYVDLADRPHNTVHANDATFYDEVDVVVQEEPLDSLDPERRGILASIGLVKGDVFAPDQRLRAVLDKAAPLGAGIARALAFRPRDPEAYHYPDSSWKRVFVGGSHEFLREGARLLDARAMFHYLATVVTPAMAASPVGTGSAYAYTAEDADARWLDGGRSYRLHLPRHIPAKTFWSVSVYDCQTRSLLVTDTPYPSVTSLSGTVEANADGTTDVHFGPTPPPGRESNWIQTVPGKHWFTMLRLHGPLQPWYDQTWRPSEVERTG
ncbi:DUF1254 domain-containing protein [Catellatospora citrea]|uniref:Phosphatidylserine decarboxylase n=1 Tax=Catellatospora citrea TaxID=53366 RepID=A0A8J3P396_9ACTN|nr:DUF1254 domain-containing protein [Catellatospora citrea]RKE09562.1 hypothetical protein C8E86_4452 [Catellatospora citrea]GIG02134.1 hypothetical protein Cci01nite_72270 [Catellatospora citrea]